MKPVLTKQDVALAIADLDAKGKKVTLSMLHAALGNRGSLTTLIRLKTEVEAERQQVADSPEALLALQTFRGIWTAAVEEGRKQQELAISECRQTVQALCGENERLDARFITAEQQLRVLKEEKVCAESELHRVQTQSSNELQRAAAALTDALQRLSSTQSAHAEQVSQLQAELNATVHRAHDIELELARAQARLGIQRPDALQPENA